MNKHQNQDSNQSDNQGFVANKIRIHSQQPIQNEQKIQFKLFQPKYLQQYGSLKKQPQEVHAKIDNIPIRNITKTPGISHKNDEKLKQPQSAQSYYNIQEYQPVYNRFKKPLNSQLRSSFQNQVDLKNLSVNGESKLKKIKEFNQNIIKQTINNNSTQKLLSFDSQIQCGNLLSAYKAKSYQNVYEFLMQNDTNTYGYNQWFYFAVKNMKINTNYTFKITNFKKSYSFFKIGQQPLLFSLKKVKETGNGWYKDGTNIKFYQSQYQEKGNMKYYTLQFNISFQYENDYVTLSPYLPYSYSRLIKYIKKYEKIAENNDLYWNLRSLTVSLGQNDIPYITLTKKQSNLKKKKNIVLLGRQHSGQNLSSFLAEELMSQLVEQKTKESQWILQNYVIKIIPMINVDGVIYGNFRCDLAGYDINRCWKNTIPSLHPQIIQITNQLNYLNNSTKGIQMCLDLHTHSKDLGAFAYCCVQNQKCREFPYILSRITSIFRYSACTFSITPQKQTTARAKIYGITNNINTITIELSSFGFKDRSTNTLISYTPQIIHHLSRSILKGIFCYSLKLHPERQPLIINQIVYNNQAQETIYEEEERPISGSDSQPEIDEIDIQVKMKKIFPEDIIQNIKKIKKNQKSPSKRIKTIKKSKQLSNQGTQSQQQKNNPPKKNKFETTFFKKSQKGTNIDSIQYGQQLSKTNQMLKKSKINFYNKIQQQQQFLSNRVDNVIDTNKTKFQSINKQRKSTTNDDSAKKMPSIVSVNKKKQPDISVTTSMEITQTSLAAFTLVKTHNRLDKTFSTYQAMVRPRNRLQNKKAYTKQLHNIPQEAPFLYILSQTKKQRLRQPCSDKQIKDNTSNIYINNQKKAILTKFKESQKNPMQILSRVLNKKEQLHIYQKKKFFN